MDEFAEIQGVNLHFTDTGLRQGTPVVVMHGWGCDLTTVASITDAISDRCRVISVDLPGHGKSSEPPLFPDGKPWGVYEYADCIASLLEKLGIKKPVLIGHSYGGRIAIVMGSRQQAEKIILVDAAGITPKRKPKYYIKIYSFKTAKKMLPILMGKKKAEKVIERMRKKAGSTDYRNSSPVMRMVMSRSVNQDLRKHLPDISAPTLLIWGENDTATPLSDGQLMEKLIPDAGLVCFKGASHYSFLDNPGQFKTIIRNFI